MIPLEVINNKLRGNPENVLIGPSDNCWEIVQCGRHDQCAAFLEKRGRQCFLYDHTFCFGEDMGPFHVKIKECVNHCEFYKSLTHEIGDVWVEAHRRIAEMAGSSDQEKTVSEVLEERAELLKHTATEEMRGDHIDVVVFRLGLELYAIETHYVYEIRPLTDVTPVPCTPDFVLGVTTIRGSVYSVVDIRQSLGAEERTASADSMFVVLNWKNVEVCLFVDAIFQKHAVLKEEIKAPALSTKNATSVFVSGLFQLDNKIVTLINWDAFLSHGNIIIVDSDI